MVDENNSIVVGGVNQNRFRRFRSKQQSNRYISNGSKQKRQERVHGWEEINESIIIQNKRTNHSIK